MDDEGWEVFCVGVGNLRKVDFVVRYTKSSIGIGEDVAILAKSKPRSSKVEAEK